MADKTVLIDTSILIDYFRKSDKANSVLISLIRQGYKFKISVVTEYEIYAGATTIQKTFWDGFLEQIEVLSLNKQEVKAAVEINSLLKVKSKQIDIADLFIAATAVSKNLLFAILNRKHFDRIGSLQIL